MFLHFLFAWQNKFYILDNAIACILNIIKYLVLSTASIFMLQSVKELACCFQGSLYKALGKNNLDKDKFHKFVCFPDCGKLYNYTDAICFDNKTKQNISKTCDNIPYPNHPQLKMRNPCGAILMKTVCSYDGKESYLYPKKIYAFQSLKNAHCFCYSAEKML